VAAGGGEGAVALERGLDVGLLVAHVVLSPV
jgi:hypothetical protein